MRKALLAVVAFAAFWTPLIARAQVISSSNMSCTVGSGGGMGCNGLAVPDAKNEQTSGPKLHITDYTFQPNAVLNRSDSSSDFLIIGIEGGDVLNDKTLVRISLAKDFVTLMPKEVPFSLRNDSAQNIKFRVIEIRR